MLTNHKAITLIRSLMRDLRITEHIVFTVDGPIDSDLAAIQTTIPGVMQ